MITNQELQNYREKGFILIRNFFDKKETDNILAEVKRVFAIQIHLFSSISIEEIIKKEESCFAELVFDLFKNHFDVFTNCSKQVQHLISLHKFGVQNKLLEVLTGLGLEFPIISVRPCVLMNSKYLDKDGDNGRYWRLPSHQDWYYSQGSLDSVTVWYPLISVNSELGALQLVPESHKWGLQKTENSYGELDFELEDDKYISFDMDKGDVLIFNSLLIHRSGVNNTNKIRWSSQLRFNNLIEETFVDRNFPLPFVYHPTRILSTPNFPTKNTLESFFTGN
jgi:phytanoyl-CoA hydroxylase